jgi:hypothetical protein
VEVVPAKRLCSSLGSFTAFMGTVAGTCDEPAPAESEEEEAPAAKSELEIYFELPDAGMEEDILEWWPRHEALLPNLSRMARQYLGVSATSTSCKRVFSTSGRIFGPENQHMTGENLSERMWAKINKP